MTGPGWARAIVGLVLALTTTAQTPGQGLVWEFLGSYAAYGSAIGIGDADGDGVGDIQIDDTANPAIPGGRIQVFSGATGMEIGVVLPPPGETFSSIMSRVGDVNGDGLADVPGLTFAVGPPLTAVDLFAQWAIENPAGAPAAFHLSRGMRLSFP